MYLRSEETWGFEYWAKTLEGNGAREWGTEGSDKQVDNCSGSQTLGFYSLGIYSPKDDWKVWVLKIAMQWRLMTISYYTYEEMKFYF